MEGLNRRLIFSALLIFFMIAFGTTGYMVIEGWKPLDALYMTIITLTTVGYREIHELSTKGIIFTIILLIGGVGTVFYALGTGAKFILEGELQEVFGKRRMERRIKSLRGHYIICGYGRMGKIICRELKEKNLRFIVIEKNAEAMEKKDEVLIFQGDATRDEVLRDAGIEKAKGLISVLPTDAENLYVVLSARQLNPGLFIVAMSGEEGS
ncbi:MAG: potassium channel protein, partial [Nitrospirales bacterium]|nr:potassium channel protein [Nitrospirales bacterium]